MATTVILFAILAFFLCLLGIMVLEQGRELRATKERLHNLEETVMRQLMNQQAIAQGKHAGNRTMWSEPR